MENSFLIPVHPKWVKWILSGYKTIEVRKSVPKQWIDYFNKKGPKPEPCDVFIYCTKGKPYLHFANGCIADELIYPEWITSVHQGPDDVNGKVIAKFTLAEVEEIYGAYGIYNTDTMSTQKLAQRSMLSNSEMDEYLKNDIGYALYITELVEFRHPKSLSAFVYGNINKKPIEKAPQNWMYAEEAL